MQTADIIPFFEANGVVALPHTVPGQGGFIVEELTVNCRRCERSLPLPHGTKADWENCTDFVLAAACEPCRCVTQAHMRIYSDGRVLHRGNEGWSEHFAQSRWQQFRAHAARLFSFRGRQ